MPIHAGGKMKRKVICLLLVCVVMTGLFAGRAAFAEETVESTSRAALLMDSGTGTVIYEKDPEKRLQIASMVKIMTLNVIFDEIDAGNLSYDEMIVASDNAASMGGSQAFLDAGSEYKASELIKSIIVASANDSCVAMAERISGSVPAFVERMNATAAEYGMENTYFVNCTGLPAPNQYSCASDVAVMTRELKKHNDFFEFAGVWMFDFVHPGGRVTGLSNTNKLVRFYKGCDGGKTGFTSEALSCLSATAKRGDTRLICVVIGAENSKARNAEVSELFNYGFANYESRTVIAEGEIVDESIAVSGGKKDTICGVAKSNVSIFCKKGSLQNIEKELHLDKVSAPVRKGDKIGEIRIMLNGEETGQTDILANEDVMTKNYRDFVDDIVEKW